MKSLYLSLGNRGASTSSACSNHVWKSGASSFLARSSTTLRMIECGIREASAAISANHSLTVLSPRGCSDSLHCGEKTALVVSSLHKLFEPIATAWTKSSDPFWGYHICPGCGIANEQSEDGKACLCSFGKMRGPGVFHRERTVSKFYVPILPVTLDRVGKCPAAMLVHEESLIGSHFVQEMASCFDRLSTNGKCSMPVAPASFTLRPLRPCSGQACRKANTAPVKPSRVTVPRQNPSDLSPRTFHRQRKTSARRRRRA